MDMHEGDVQVSKALRIWAWIVAGLILVVNQAGFLDTVTGSALGCGKDWPLCNGAVVPGRFTLQTLIEFAHRSIVAVATLAAVILAIWAWRAAGRLREVRLFVGVGMAFIVVQAALGAMAVLFVNPTWVLAFHFGCALLAFVGFFLLALFLSQRAGSGVRLRARPAPPAVRAAAWVTIAYTFVAVYYAAYISFRGDGLACGGWPLCQGRIIPPSGPPMIDFIHRLAAVALLGFVVWMVVAARRARQHRPDLWRGALAVLGLTLAQAATGAVVADTRLAIWAFLLHVTVMMGLFGAQAYVALETVAEPAREVVGERWQRQGHSAGAT